MEKVLEWKSTKVFYNIEGQGKVLCFLHGYLESMEIWSTFSDRFIPEYSVLRIDIPGHGKSGIVSENHSMEEMATIVHAILEKEQIASCTLIGHSMGGYVCMAFVNQFPDMLDGFCLFHSTCFADDELRQEKRNKEIRLVERGLKLSFISANVQNAFATINHEVLSTEIQLAKEIASRSSGEGIIALLGGMRDRKENSELLKKYEGIVLLIYGERDNYISKEVFDQLTHVAPGASILRLKESGHMGFLEEPEKAYLGMINFLNRNKKTGTLAGSIF